LRMSGKDSRILARAVERYWSMEKIVNCGGSAAGGMLEKSGREVEGRVGGSGGVGEGGRSFSVFSFQRGRSSFAKATADRLPIADC
jgi:hypothetical protein